MRPGKPLRVPKLVIPKEAPVAIVREPAKPAPAVEAPVVAAPEAPKPVVRKEESKPAVQLVASAPVTPVVVPVTAPTTEPIARPQAAPPAPAQPKPVARPATIVVQAGQSLADIARQWDNSVPALMMENNLVSERVKPGQKLKLPPAGRK